MDQEGPSTQSSLRTSFQKGCHVSLYVFCALKLREERLAYRNGVCYSGSLVVDYVSRIVDYVSRIVDDMNVQTFLYVFTDPYLYTLAAI